LPGGECELAHKTRDTCVHAHWCTYPALLLHMMHVEPQLMMRLRHRHMQWHSKPLRTCCLLPVPAAGQHQFALTSGLGTRACLSCTTLD
jgi:hypothetical protein